VRADTFLWYLRRPKFYSYMIEEISRKFRSIENLGDRSSAGVWCESVSVTRNDVFSWLGITDNSVPREIMEFVEKRDEAAPTAMGGAGDYRLLYNLVASRGYLNCLESGVSKGWTSMAILAGLGDAPKGRLVSVDMPYPKLGLESWVGCCVPDSLIHRWTLIREPDRNGLRRSLDLMSLVDLFHYDSDKSYWGRKFAFELVWDRINPGGYLIMDNISDNFAFRDIVTSNRLKDHMKVYKNGSWVGLIQKPESP